MINLNNLDNKRNTIFVSRYYDNDNTKHFQISTLDQSANDVILYDYKAYNYKYNNEIIENIKQLLDNNFIVIFYNLWDDDIDKLYNNFLSYDNIRSEKILQGF